MGGSGSFPADIGPDALWFVRNFREQFGREPEYTAAGSFALGLIFGECLQRAGSLCRTTTYWLLPRNSTVTPSMAGSGWIRLAADRSGTVFCSFSGSGTTRSCYRQETSNRPLYSQDA